HITYKVVDKSDDNVYINVPIQILNNSHKGLPPHELNLKVGAIDTLLRNLSIADGFCNNIRLKIRKLFEYNTEDEVRTREGHENKVFISKVTLNAVNTSSLPFILYKEQFPLVLAFAMTIYKSEGQSFNLV
ncbi:uncharacterized protein LOC106646491, partial [Copidosoma floridanum]|uniref:uncharacterized protein LOC106646491 n=1 Tax=Copidosoma floridanum TaxID=29053 RepID=UPI0006C941AF